MAERTSLERLEELTFKLPHIDTAPPRIVERFLNSKAVNGGVNLYLSEEMRVSRCFLPEGQSILSSQEGIKEVFIVYLGEVAFHVWGDVVHYFKEGGFIECSPRKTSRLEAVKPSGLLRVTIFQKESKSDAPGKL